MSALARRGPRVADAAIALFRAGFDTCEIACLLSIPEADAMALLSIARGIATAPACVEAEAMG